MDRRREDPRRESGLLLAVLGLIAIWGPLGYVALEALGVMPGGLRPTTRATLVAGWAIAWILGSVTMILGLGRLGGPKVDGMAHARSKRAVRIAGVAGVALLLGFLLLLVTFAFIDSCQPPCRGGGGVVGNDSTSSASCGATCAVNFGDGQLVWPIQLLAISIMLGVTGASLATVAVGRAIYPTSVAHVNPRR
jgi:hypothetical protein